MLDSWPKVSVLSRLQPSFLASKPPTACPVPIPVTDNTHFRVIPDMAAADHHHHDDGDSSPSQFISPAISVRTERTDSDHAGPLSRITAAGDEPTRTQNSLKERDLETARAEAETVPTLVSEVEERGGACVGSRLQSKTDSPSKRKGNR